MFGEIVLGMGGVVELVYTSGEWYGTQSKTPVVDFLPDKLWRLTATFQRHRGALPRYLAGS